MACSTRSRISTSPRLAAPRPGSTSSTTGTAVLGKAADWTGRWKIYRERGQIDIERKGTDWYVDGMAFWGSGASTNLGQLGGELLIQGSRAHVGTTMTDDADECGADLVRIGDFLIVHDNQRCGGLNVRFDGVYPRVR